MVLWSLVLVVLPSLWVLLSAMSHIVERHRSAIDSGNDDHSLWFWLILRSANPAGTASVVSLGFFLIPVSRHASLLHALQISPIHSLRLHVWAGRLCCFLATWHGLLYCFIFGMWDVERQRKQQQHDGGTAAVVATFWRCMWKSLIPPGHCFAYLSPLGFLETMTREELDRTRHHSGNSDANTTNQTIMMWRSVGENSSNGPDMSPRRKCYGYWLNFTGFLSVISLIIVFGTSLNSIRRANYRFFYISHIVLGWAMLIFAIMHYYYIVLYLMPSMIYYLCTTSPVLIQSISSYFLDSGGGGVQLLEFTVLAKSNGCCEMVLAVDPTSNGALDLLPAAPYVKICIPELSLMSYPFTVARLENDRLYILFRQYGYFTRQLRNRLWLLQQDDDDDSSRPRSPTILVDGFYSNSSDWSRTEHDVLLLVSGGVGVTPMLSTLSKILRQQQPQGHLDNNNKQQQVYFHWYCRDDGLIWHVLKTYLLPMFAVTAATEQGEATTIASGESASIASSSHSSTLLDGSFATNPATIEIYIHHTGLSNNASMDDDGEDPVEFQLDGLRDSFIEEESATQVFQVEPAGQQQEIDPTQSFCYRYPSNNNGGHNDELSRIKQPMASANLSIWATNGTSCWMVIFVFAIFLFLSLWFHATFYKHFIRRYPLAVAFRAYSLYLVGLMSLILGIVLEFFRRWRSIGRRRLGYGAASPGMADDEEEPCKTNGITNGLDKNDDDTPCRGGDRVPVLPMKHQLGNGGLLLLHPIQCGRPEAEAVMQPTATALDPALFLCGPHVLLQSLLVANKDRCTVYQETFEM